MTLTCPCCKCDDVDPEDMATTARDAASFRAAFGGDVCNECAGSLVTCTYSGRLVLIDDCNTDRDGNYYAPGQIHHAERALGEPLNDWS